MTIFDNDEIYTVYIPQLIVTDDAVTFPFKNIQSLDFASLSELIQLTPSAQYDDALFSENLILNAAFNLLDFASVTDSFLSLEVNPEVDSAILSEFIASPVFVDGVSDAITFADFISIAFGASDLATLNENIAIAIESSDSAALQEFNNINLFGSEDYSSFLEEQSNLFNQVYSEDIVENQYEESGNFAQLDPPDKDYYIIYDLPHVDVNIPAYEDPATFAENNLIISFDGIDSLSVADSINNIYLDGIALTDYAELFENVAIATSASTVDIFFIQETALVEAQLSSNESSLVSELSQLNAQFALIDNISFEENISVGPSITDAATLSESVSIAIRSSDSLNLIEKKAVSVVGRDLAILTELNRINANASGKDFMTVSERNPFISLIGNQIAYLTETPFYNADWHLIDYGFLIREDAFASILKEDFDFLAVTESTPNIGPNAFELITFKEKKAIGVAAPIILNINEYPTVHGTVTGDVVIVSMSGTEPVLL